MEILFKNPEDVSDHWLDYIEHEAKCISDVMTELEIENYMDRNALNPQMNSFLLASATTDVPVITNAEKESVILTAAENSFTSTYRVNLLGFKNLKRKIRSKFCEIIGGLENLKFKDIIKQLLLALIPSFAAGVPAIALPIIVGRVAIFLKKGYEAVCPLDF